MVPSVIVGDNAGIFKGVPGVDPPLTSLAPVSASNGGDEVDSEDEVVSPTNQSLTSESLLISLTSYTSD